MKKSSVLLDVLDRKFMLNKKEIIMEKEVSMSDIFILRNILKDC